MDKYTVGQVLTVKEDTEMEGCFGTPKSVKKGSKIFIGADKLAHHLDGTLQPVQSEIEGFSVEGLAEWIWNHLTVELPLKEALSDYDVTPDEFKTKVADALEELGMYDHTGNRS